MSRDIPILEGLGTDRSGADLPIRFVDDRPNGKQASIVLGGDSLSPLQLWGFARLAENPHQSLRIHYAPEALKRIDEATALLGRLVASEEAVYGVNTGFGHFANVVIPPDKVVELQKNIVRSHCCGVGELLSRDLVMAMWLIDLNTICQGHSGVGVSTMERIARILEAGVLACIPSQGSVGASGDLAPGAHAVQAMMGEGRCTLPDSGRFVEVSAVEAFQRLGVDPIELGPKEGLSLINGTHLTTAMAVKAWYEARYLLEVANLAAAMTIEALSGSRMNCHALTMKAHVHPGTIACGGQVSSWLGESSDFSHRHEEDRWIQDPYSLRCVGQVHGSVWEELDSSERTLENEINATTDNPLLFADEMQVLYCGNFHAIYPARVSDRLASALTTLSSISERRINQAMKAPRGHLPTFLVKDGGLRSGFMMAHVTAAALVSENKSWSFPASVDSIPTNVTQEDHVSMGPTAGMKALRVVENLRRVLAIELLAAAQAMSLQRPLKPGPRLAAVYERIREFVPPLEEDRNLSDDIELIADKIHQREIIPR
jgi:histidine ammonia-lyase